MAAVRMIHLVSSGACSDYSVLCAFEDEADAMAYAHAIAVNEARSGHLSYRRGGDKTYHTTPKFEDCTGRECVLARKDDYMADFYLETLDLYPASVGG